MTVAEQPVYTGHDALAADGRIVRIRPVRPEDTDALRELYDTASDRSLYLRFFSHGRGPIEPEVRRLVRPPAADHLALVACEDGVVLGVASYERDPDAAG